MSKHEYKIQHHNINSYTDETSSVSLISYEIENANYNGINKDDIYNQLEKLKKVINSLKTLNM